MTSTDFSSHKVGLKLKDMCAYMGISDDERHLFWVAELALLAKLPPYWKQYKDEEGHAYFHNHATNVTSWTHPRDAYFLELLSRERNKIKTMQQLAEQQRRIKWDPAGRLEGTDLSNGNTTALHNSDAMYPSLRTANKMVQGTHCFQIRIDKLLEDGFMMIGMAKENFHYNEDAIPPDDYNCHGYTTIGEIYVCGKLIQSSLEKLAAGDLVTMVVHFDKRTIVWYKNRHPVGFYEGFEGSQLYPCLIFGYKGYQASIVRAEQLPHALPKWMPDNQEQDKPEDEKRIILSNRSFTARSNSATGYSTVRTANYFDIDSPYFEVTVEMLARDGFLMIGLANDHVHESPTQIPAELYNHYGYAATGEAFALGVRVRTGLPRMNVGDVIGMRLLLEEQRVIFYLNYKPVCELVDLPTYEQYYACCTLGNAGYQVRINPCPPLPLGLPRWLSDSMNPPRFLTAEGGAVVKAKRSSQCVTVISSVEYETGKEYFEVNLVAIHPEAELCVGLAAPAVVDNFRAIPATEYRHFGYCSSGEVVALGQVAQTGLPRLRVPDRLGVLVDLSRHVLLFFHNGHPVAIVNNNLIRARLTTCLTCVGQFEALLDPTPAVPAFPPEWDPERAQDNIVVSKDRLTAQVNCDTESARSIWSTSVYNRGALYLEMQVELHGRSGWIAYGVGNRNMGGAGKFATRAALPYEEYYVIGYTSRGDIINGGAVERCGEEQWCNGDRMGLYIDFVAETFAAYKNGFCVVVGNCPGVGVGVSPMATFVYGPHSLRLIPLPRVPNLPQRWDSRKCHSEVVLSLYDLMATNQAQNGYPTIVGTQVLRHGVHYFEVTIEFLPPASCLVLGVTGGPAHQANERIPPGEYHCYGYASTGEIWAHGARVQGGREEFVTGDTFGILIDVDAGTLTFFRNDYPVGMLTGMEGPGVADGVRPCCTFGYTNYAVRINPCARVPEGTPRFDMLCKSPDIEVSHDHLTSTCTSYLACHTARGTSGFSSGVVYFEVRVNYIKLGGYVALCLGAHNLHQNTAVYPVAHYNAFCYTSQGELLRRGEIYREGLARVVSGDDMGFRADFNSGLVIFYKNRHPIGQMQGISGELFPAVIYANEKYSTTIHTNARERLEVPAFDVRTCPPQIKLESYHMSAHNVSQKGFPTVRAAAAYRSGSFFFEVSIDKLQYGGFLLIGVGSLNLPDNNDYLPGEKFNSYAYSSSGEIFALGEVVSGGHTHYQEGDMVGLICNLDKMVATFYINTHEVGQVRNLSKHMEYAPFVVFGNGKFQVTINRVPNIAKIFALKQHTADDTKKSKADNFRDPNLEQVVDDRKKDNSRDAAESRPASAHLFDTHGKKKDGDIKNG